MSEPAANAILGGGEACAVEVRALARELHRLWQATSGPDAAGRPAAITRACTRNLIALARDEACAERATSLIAQVAVRHPVRAFVVTADAGGPADRLDAYLSAHCALRGEGRHVCCEQITLRVGAAARQRAAGAIVPLLVPDLPVIVWCVDDLDWRDPILTPLLDVADRLLVDSRRLSDSPAALEGFAGSERADEWSPGDFEWARLAPWREAAAAMFEDSPEALAPSAVARVEVEFGAMGPRIGAALLAGWLGDRLTAARERAASGLRARVESGDGAGDEEAPDFVLTPIEGAAPGAVCGLVLGTDRGAVFRVTRETGQGLLMLVGGTADSPRAPRRLPCAVEDDGALLGDLLDVRGPDELYEQALARAAALVVGAAPD